MERPKSILIGPIVLCIPVIIAMVGFWISGPLHTSKFLLSLFGFLPTLFVLYRVTQRDTYARWLVGCMCLFVIGVGILLVYRMNFAEYPDSQFTSNAVDGMTIVGESAFPDGQPSMARSTTWTILSMLWAAIGLVALFLPDANRWFSIRG